MGGPKEGQSLAGLLTQINTIRANHGALHWLRNITFHSADDENILVFSKRRVYADGGEDVILVAANLDPHSTRHPRHLDLPALGLSWGDEFVAHDLLTDEQFTWGEHPFVRLGPETTPVHVIHVRRS